MDLTRRHVLAGALGGTSALALTACGFGAGDSGSSESPAASATSTGPLSGSITFSFWGGSDGETKGFTYAKTTFEAANPGTTIKLNIVPYEGFFSGIDRGIQAGNAPDLFRVDYTTLGKYTSKEVLLDVTPYFTQEEIDAFLPAMWQAVLYDGKAYGAPHQIDTSLVVYDVDAFKAAGITSVPTTLDTAWTWDEFSAVATQLRSSLPATQFPFAYNWTAAGAFRWLTWLNAAGGSLLTEDLSGPALPSDQGTKSLDYTQSFFTNKWVPASNTVKGAKYSDEFFMAKTVPMSFIGSFSIPYLADPKNGYKGNWGGTFLPRDVTASADLGGNAIVPTAGTKNPDLAVAFLKWLVSEPMMKYFCEQAIELPTLKSLASQQLDYVYRPEVVNIAAQQATTISDAVVKTTTMPAFSSINTTLQDQLEKSFNGASAADVQTAIAAGVTAAIG